jgi:hypothetical protein
MGATVVPIFLAVRHTTMQCVSSYRVTFVSCTSRISRMMIDYNNDFHDTIMLFNY